MKYLVILLSIAVFISCKSKPKQAEETVKYSLEKIWETDSLLTTSESAVFDSVHNVIYVSCINGDPRTKDGNGFIAKVSPEGKIIDRYWITTLDAPKGLGLYKNILYAADIDNIAVVNTSEDKIMERLPVFNAGMLNDITVAPNGRIYVSDMDSDNVYTALDGEVDLFLNKEINRPNGLLDQKDDLLILSMSDGELYSVDFDSMTKSKALDGLPSADGIIEVADQTYIVSNWNGELTLITPDMKKQSLLNTIDKKINTADIGFIKDKNIVLVPTFGHNTLAAYKLVKK
ncbi:hypothetical protein ACE1ET_06475 [Saccharicrinis sp. FJH62]|uniref:hypothetical protein n=1 Tax=Saccharicrinis sp. FJH62 TaxID=3344657 RepID=UPI0035D3F5A5